MTRAEGLQLAGIAQMSVAMAWILGPWFLLLYGALFLIVPEVLMARSVRQVRK